MSCVFVFLMTIDIVVIVQLVPWGCLYSSFHSQEGGGGYKKGNRVRYNMFSIMTLSLLI
jgi:hypothetical protein